MPPSPESPPARAGARSLAFGTAFTAHMVSMRWTTERGWHEMEVMPHEPLVMDPAMVGIHYGQSVFEGLKAHRVPGGVAVFRPEAHAARLRASARRLMMPELPESAFLAAVDALVGVDQGELPDDPGVSLYLRPIVFATERTLALRPAQEYRFLLMAFLTEGYFGSEQRAVSVWVTTEFSRAAPGGTGFAKCAGNYAGSLMAQELAKEQGCDQVVWLDPVERRWVEEMGGMNLFFVHGAGSGARLVTPPLNGNLLPGVTRDSILRLAPDLGIAASEEPVSVDGWRAGCASGEITEVFACGTAARVTAVGQVKSEEGGWTVGDGSGGEVTNRILATLSGIQGGQLPDRHSWLRRVTAADQ
ncbi:branched-chain amino acid aminotransferase [Actinomadura opuntiae]|uniref:branched-chain amino acid aminotransferase n=1 Tax=Actinomadura sp. OS1-43 TaxID=604315 RepID=UPI00255A957E|nr:branched-chain amino acid aminotransferase [Actinomadura sp. OS1-43]MDL4818701.1 branched-chain amino acid aminotransferase [Actinomadura sp. OS1-43]